MTFIQKYTECTCIPPHASIPDVSQNWEGAVKWAESSPRAEALLGVCERSCDMLPPFLMLLFVITLVASNNQMPLIMVTLRSVSEEEKAFALGLQVVMLRLVAYIPAPIIFGTVIDTTCLVWKMNECQEEGTTCLLYDIEAFRFRYGLVALCFKVSSLP